MPLIGSALSLPMPAGVGVSTASAFSPLDLSPALWLDASDETTLSGPGGGAISTWSDKSGNGNNFTQNTSAYQPTSGTRTINGLNTLDFDADLLENSPVTLSGAQPITVFVVAEPDADQYGRLLRAAGNTAELSTAYLTSGRMIESAGTSLISSGSDYSSGTPYISRFTFDSTSSSIHLNGISVASGDAGTTDLDNRTTMRFGAYEAGTQHFNGKIGEVIVCADGALTAQQIAATEQYLTEKWMPVPLRVGATAWFDASDTDSITQSGGLVSQLNDLSGNGNNLTQGTSANQPLTGSRTLNGLNVLDFDDNVLVNATFTTTSPYTLIAVAELDNQTSSDYLLSSNLLDVVLGFQNVGNAVFIYNDSQQVAGANISTGSHLIVATFDGSSSSVRLNGASYITGTVGTLGMSDLYVGRRSDGAGIFYGGFAEAIIVDGTLTAGQIADTETYLANKWGITI